MHLKPIEKDADCSEIFARFFLHVKIPLSCALKAVLTLRMGMFANTLQYPLASMHDLIIYLMLCVNLASQIIEPQIVYISSCSLCSLHT